MLVYTADGTSPASGFVLNDNYELALHTYCIYVSVDVLTDINIVYRRGLIEHN